MRVPSLATSLGGVVTVVVALVAPAATVTIMSQVRTVSASAPRK
jgi:hypothetical protein